MPSSASPDDKAGAAIKDCHDDTPGELNNSAESSGREESTSIPRPATKPSMTDRTAAKRTDLARPKTKVDMATPAAEQLDGKTLLSEKTGFDIPAHEWLRGPLAAAMAVSLTAAAGAGAVNPIGSAHALMRVSELAAAATTTMPISAQRMSAAAIQKKDRDADIFSP